MLFVCVYMPTTFLDNLALMEMILLQRLDGKSQEEVTMLKGNTNFTNYFESLGS